MDYFENNIRLQIRDCILRTQSISLEGEGDTMADSAFSIPRTSIANSHGRLIEQKEDVRVKVEEHLDWLQKAAQIGKRKILGDVGDHSEKRIKLNEDGDFRHACEQNLEGNMSVKYDGFGVSEMPKQSEVPKQNIPDAANLITGLTVNDVEGMKVAELRIELKKRNFNATGLKKQLQDRLKEAITESSKRLNEQKSTNETLPTKSVHMKSGAIDRESGNVGIIASAASKGEIASNSNGSECDEERKRRIQAQMRERTKKDLRKGVHAKSTFTQATKTAVSAASKSPSKAMGGFFHNCKENFNSRKRR